MAEVGDEENVGARKGMEKEKKGSRIGRCLATLFDGRSPRVVELWFRPEQDRTRLTVDGTVYFDPLTEAPADGISWGEARSMLRACVRRRDSEARTRTTTTGTLRCPKRPGIWQQGCVIYLTLPTYVLLWTVPRRLQSSIQDGRG